MDNELYDKIIYECDKVNECSDQIHQLESNRYNILEIACKKSKQLFGFPEDSDTDVTLNKIKSGQFTDHGLTKLFNHWQIYLASTVKVRRTIRLRGQLCINHLFGLKMYRCHTSHNIFDTRRRGVSNFPILTDDNVLQNSESDFKDLKELFNHPLVDQNKLIKLYELTSEICSLIRDRNLLMDDEARETISFVSSLFNSYHSSDFVDRLRDVKRYYDKYSCIVGLIESINDKRTFLENKWDDINKNYKLIMKLTDKKLRV